LADILEAKLIFIRPDWDSAAIVAFNQSISVRRKTGFSYLFGLAK